MDEYLGIKKTGGDVKFMTYIRNRFNDNFYIQLISCPICLDIWLSIILCIIIGQPLVFPIICYFSLIGYFLLKNILKNSNHII